MIYMFFFLKIFKFFSSSLLYLWGLRLLWYFLQFFVYANFLHFFQVLVLIHFLISSINFLCRRRLSLLLFPLILSFKMFNKIIYLSLSSDDLQGLIFFSLFWGVVKMISFLFLLILLSLLSFLFRWSSIFFCNTRSQSFHSLHMYLTIVHDLQVMSWFQVNISTQVFFMFSKITFCYFNFLVNF